MIRFFKYSSTNYQALQKNQKHMHAQKHALNIYKANAIYSFIPKNACSTMRTSIAYANGCISDKQDFNWIHANNQTFSANLADLVRADYTFTILRCPYARLVSVYLDKFVSRSTLAWQFYNLIDRKMELEQITFAKFIEKLKEPGIRRGNAHWQPQSDFLVYKNYDDYFNLENFSKISTTLKKKIDLDIIDARELTGHGIDNLKPIENENFSETMPNRIYNLKRQGQTPTPKSLYSDELIEIVKKFYMEDLKLYNEVIDTPQLMFD